MFGKRKNALGLAWRVILYYLSFCAASAAAAAVFVAIARSDHWGAWGGLQTALVGGAVALLPAGLGGWLIYRILSPIVDIERQLRTLAQTDGPTLKTIRTRGAAALGWNRLAQRLQQDDSSVSIADRLEAALAAHSGGHIDAAMQSLSDGLAVTDMEGRISFANRALAALLADHDAEDGLQQGCIFDLLATADDAGSHTLLDSAAAARTVIAEVSPHCGGDGRLLRAARHPLNSGDVQTGYVWSIRDITQQRLADQMRDQFLDSATHELRTPLANIKAYAETLALDDMLDVECQKDFCNTINAEATRLARLIDDLLDLSSMEVGSLSITRQNVELDRLLRDVVDKVKPLVEQKSLEFDVALPEKLPEMKLDKDKIATTLVNLLGNAVKYTLTGGRVGLKVRAGDSELQIDVEDTGVGIPPADLPRVFDKFFRGADPRVQQETGTGLGLSLAREIVRLHGGELTVHSEVDKGSTFTVTLPMKKGA